KVDHSTAGALEVIEHYGVLGKILAYGIAGHHCGLPDWGSYVDESSLEGRLNKKDLPDYSAYKKEIELPKPEEISFQMKLAPVGQGFSVQFLIRFLYSALVDADFLDTEQALNNEKSSLRENKVSLEDMISTLDTFLKKKCANVPDTRINRTRAEILATCREKAVLNPGFFTLTVPTGGGKTLSSMAFALKHAVTHGMKRIIYVIPYTSIIEQNAAIFREIFGEEKVLEHHSNFTYSSKESMEDETEYDFRLAEKMRLAAENWDMPIVVTTNVQFFESLFAAKSSRCRKLHNIANSVVIIDEAQMIPTGFLYPCIYALVELVTNYNTSVVLCTATQPAINKLLPPEIKPLEIMDKPEELYKAFKRVQVKDIGEITDDELARELLRHEQVLCIVNSKKHARILYEKISGNWAYHLSTRMCPAHRSKILKTIKERLRSGEICRVVSTQLIEAGVDVDFPVVYRSYTGIDSIAQSAGRCNREGLLSEGKVFVFKPEKHGLPAGWLSRTASIGESILRRNEDPLDLKSVSDYFAILYDIEGEKLDKEKIMAEIKEQERMLNFSFRRIAEKFNLIDENTVGIIIPWDDECKKIIEKARWSRLSGKYFRQLQKYTVDVYQSELEEMQRLGLIENVGGMLFILREEVCETSYSMETGLLPCTESMFTRDIFII
ncbi:CRISPR-associated helicase, Cas3 family, partial [Carboxydocella sporoproducens DSM 16521]